MTRARLEGFAAALGERWAETPVVVLARNDPVEAEAAAERLLADGAVDAVAAMGDELALGVLRAAARLGRSVPAELAVSGWDDSAAAEAAGLTTIHQSLREQGRACALAVVQDEAGETLLRPEWRLVERATTRRASPAARTD
ncbi:substrate-binding domain-containing protein [Blastococcus sp. SYSU DS0617]